MGTLSDHREWDRLNGTLSVSLEPSSSIVDNKKYVLLNGSTGNFCLDYSNEYYDRILAKQRAWSTDTGYYIKINNDDDVIITGWWDDIEERIPYKRIEEDPKPRLAQA